MKHLSFERLVELAERPDAARPKHLEACAACAGELVALIRMFATMRRDPGGEPSEAARERAHSLFDDLARSPGQRLAARLTRFAATLVQDSGGLVPAAAGARGAAVQSRQLLYSAGDLDIDIAWPSGGDGSTLRGQILSRSGAGESCAMRPLSLVDSAGRERAGQTDADGQFRFEDIADERYELRVDLEAGLLVVPIDLGTRS